MLTAVVLHLRPVAEARLPKSHGSFAYAAAREALVGLHSPLGRILTLHKGNKEKEAERKPLTCSLLAGTDPQDGVDLFLSPDHIYAWRLTGLTSEISQHLPHLSPPDGIRIDKAVFFVEKVSTAPTEHPEVKQETYEALLARWEKKRNLREVSLRFPEPGATFRVGRKQQPFPLPYWVFRSLLSTWKAFAPPHRDLQETLVKAVRAKAPNFYPDTPDEALWFT